MNFVERENVMADSREVMNIRQASQYLGVSPDTLYKYVNEQKIPAFKLGNRWRFKKSKLDQWMEEKSMETEPQGKKKIKAAVKAAVMVEDVARTVFYALQLGQVDEILPEEVARAHRRYLEEYGQPN